MRTRSTDRYVEITAADLNEASFDRVWNRAGLIFLGLVALIIVVSLIARVTGVLPLRETAPAGETQVETSFRWITCAVGIPPPRRFRKSKATTRADRLPIRGSGLDPAA